MRARHADRPEVLLEDRDGEAVERRPDVGLVGRVSGHERRPERAVAVDQPVDGQDRGRDVAPSREPVVERGEARGVARGVECLDEGPGGRAEPAQEPHQPGAEERDAPVGEARGQERDDLPIERVLVAGGILDGVAADAGIVVVPAIQALERPTEPRRARRADPPRHRAEE